MLFRFQFTEQHFSCNTLTMEIRREEILLPTYEQSCGLPRKPLCADFFNDALKDPILIFITIAVVIGSFCLLSGLFLLCLVSKTMQDDMSESILLIGIGFFISSVACVSWKLTTRRQISHFIEAIKEETVRTEDDQVIVRQEV